jgi:hypothetical protein
MPIRPNPIFALLLATLLAPIAPAQTTSSIIQLRQGFQSPPPQAKLRCYWWWLNGNTTEDTITYELTEMSQKGFGGVLLVDANGSNQNGNANVPPGPTFGSPAWTRLYVHALKVAADLHLEVTLNITSGWNLGGPDVKPTDASKILTFSRTIVPSSHFDGYLPAPSSKNGFYRQIAVLAYPLAHGAALPGESGDPRKPIALLNLKTASAEGGFSMPPTERLLGDASASPADADSPLSAILDISPHVDPTGHTNWTPPTPGPWEILRIGYTDSDARVSTSSGAWQGLAIDYLDRSAFDTYWTQTVVPLLQAGKPYLGKSLVNLATDSWELGGTNWTGRFQAEFRARRGYDPVPYLPVIAGRIVTDRATSQRFLNDLRRTVGDLVTDHYDHFAERAKEYGLGIECESGGPHSAPLDALETFRSSAVPQTEYWAQSNEHRSSDQDRFFTKEAASAANIYGKTFVAQEGMTSIGPQWSESLATDLKPSFDQALTEGMNRLVWHEFTSSPASFGLPGNEYFAGTHLNPRVTWWNQADDFFLYLNRSQFLLQQGHAVSDVLYFYGDEVPNFARLKQDDPAHVLPGYDYDVTNEDALLHTLTLKSGAIETPSGNDYKLLMMPKGRRLSLASLERIAAYVQQGGSLAGESPLAPTGLIDPHAADRFAALTHALWDACPATHPYGAGKVFCTANGRQALQALNVAPDFEDPSHQLDYIHRVDATNDIYFVRNGTTNPVDTKAIFRTTPTPPELWSAVDGTMESQSDYTQDGNGAILPLYLAPFGSIFVVFPHRATAPAAPPRRHYLQTSSQPLPASQWTISYQPGRGAPAGVHPLESFVSWSQSSEPDVKYFSGTAIYSTTIIHRLTPKEHVFLTLTDLHEICTVRINGRVAGTIWSMPYELDITASLIEGENTLELDVTNLWPNRIIGDAQPLAGQTHTRTNIRKYTASSPLLPSGLVGPVSLKTFVDTLSPALIR